MKQYDGNWEEMKQNIVFHRIAVARDAWGQVLLRPFKKVWLEASIT